MLLSTTMYGNSIVSQQQQAKVYINKNKEQGWLSLGTGAHLLTRELTGGVGNQILRPLVQTL